MANPTDEHRDNSDPAAAASPAVPVIAASPLDPAADTPAPAVAATPASEPPKAEVPKVEAEAEKPAPAMPRAAVLPPKPEAPSVSPAPAAVASGPRMGGRSFPLLAASIALAATLGAAAGSVGISGVQQMFAPVPTVTPAPVAAVRPEPNEEVRALKDSVAQLRLNVKTLSDNLAAVRTAVTSSSSATNVQFTKITEALDRVERGHNDRHVTTLTPSPEPTGSVAASLPSGVEPKSTLKPPIVDGWVLRKVYNGSAALIEGRRFGIVEIGPGDNLPGLGRVQEIKRQDGRWVVVTPKGLIMPLR